MNIIHVCIYLFSIADVGNGVLRLRRRDSRVDQYGRHSDISIQTWTPSMATLDVHHEQTLRFQFGYRFVSIKHSHIQFSHHLFSRPVLSSCTSSLIIIMLQPSDIVPFRSPNTLPNCLLSASDHRSQQGNEGTSHHQSSSHTSGLKIPRTTSLQHYWKKQIKRHMRSLSRQRRCKSMANIAKQLLLTLNLFKTKAQIENDNVVKSSNRFLWGRTTPLCTFLPSNKVNNPACLVLSTPPSSFIKSDLFFELTVIGVSGKIQYNAIFLKKWSEIRDQLCSLANYFTIMQRFVEDKEHLCSLISCKETEFRDMADSCLDLESTLKKRGIQDSIAKESNQGSSVESQKKIDHSFIGALKVFIYTKKQVLQTILKKSSSEESKWGWIYSSLIYNLLLPSIDSVQVPFFQQMNECLPSLEVLVQKLAGEQRWNVQDKVRDVHFPGTLVNAHVCLNCKEQRGYISCSSCSRTQGKTISLCLQCYEYYHQHVNREAQGLKMDGIFEKWHTFDLNAEMILNFRRQIPQYPQEISISTKKEQ